MKKTKIAYWISTGLLSLMMIGSGLSYFFMHQETIKVFTMFGYPTYLIYPLGITKIFAVIIILLNKIKTLKEWAYAGFFLNFILATAAHIVTVGDRFYVVLLGFIFLLISYFCWKKMSKKKQIRE